MTKRATVVGIDWSKHGWVVAELSAGSYSSLEVDKSLVAVLDRHDDAEVVAIDMPIGLPRGWGERQCDVQARAFVGQRGSSVFPTPPRAALRCPSYEDANRLAKQRRGKGISRQSYGLRDRIDEVEAVARKRKHLVEVHPEVSFRELAGHELATSKTSWDGQAIRRRLLIKAGIKLPVRIGDAGRVPVADILDACVAAWSADRYRGGVAEPLPEGSTQGNRPVIWR